ncbi:hypothetical protein Kisp02_40950 [Kineosporia sp. NBRC 101731]|nr:hypothetical protein Kisp02_40950 [Kineosporia sp. NBRC 101731]
MAMKAAPSGKALTEQVKCGTATGMLAATLPVAAWGSHTDNEYGTRRARPAQRSRGRAIPAPRKVPASSCEPSGRSGIAHHAVAYAVAPGSATAVSKQDTKTRGLSRRTPHGYCAAQTPGELLT